MTHFESVTQRYIWNACHGRQLNWATVDGVELFHMQQKQHAQVTITVEIIIIIIILQAKSSEDKILHRTKQTYHSSHLVVVQIHAGSSLLNVRLNNTVFLCTTLSITAHITLYTAELFLFVTGTLQLITFQNKSQSVLHKRHT